MNGRSLSWIAAWLLVCAFALWGAAAAQDLVPQPTPNAAADKLFTATAAAQSALTIMQTVEAAFNQAYAATVVPQITATAAAQSAADMTLLADIPQSRGADGAFILGDPDAPITVIVFMDWACPHCQTYHTETVIPFIESEVASGRAALEARLFPTAGGALTVSVAQAVECMVEGGASFWSLDHALFERAQSGGYSGATARELAAEVRADFAAVQACAADADQVEIDTEFGRGLGITGTPAVMIRRGSGAPEFITHDNTTYSRGGVPLAVLTAVVAAAQPS